MKINVSDLMAKGVYVSRINHVHRIKELVKKLWPIETNLSLRRYGDCGDGGYLMPTDLNNISACFSPGVDRIASFEQHLSDLGVYSHLADYSVESPPSGLKFKTFTKKFIGPINSDIYITLNEWVGQLESCSNSSDYILQMDIEGAEYSSILAASDNILKKFKYIVIEIHDVQSWGEVKFFDIVQDFFVKLLNFHMVVHMHPNNCCGLVDLGGIKLPRVFEMTLVRRDVALPIKYCTQFPHTYDAPNVSGIPDLTLPSVMFSQEPQI